MHERRTYKHITIQPLSGSFAAEIGGVNLGEPLDDATFDEVRRAWLDYKVVFFREQSLTPAQHRDFAARFGAFQPPGFVPVLDDYPEVRRQLVTPDSVSKDVTWHTDDTFYEVPSKCSVLYALEVPKVGGDTVWSNLEAAYEALSDTMKGVLDGLTAVHDVSYYNAMNAIGKWGGKHFDEVRKNVPPVEHPLVRTHPETGHKSLFISEFLVSHIKGMKEKESRALLELLFRHTQEEEFLCRFKWRDGSVAFWDNRCTQHRGIFDFTLEPGERRLMHRVAIADTERPR
jgi:taurine dioxygenase